MCGGKYAMKGQSAIEYLMTYGWMLLVVAVVSGMVYTLADTGCREEVSSYVGQQPGIEQFGTGEDFMALSLRNPRTDNLEIDEISFVDPETGDNRTYTFSETLDAGRLGTYSMPLADGECNSYDFSINYNISTLSDQYSSGRLTVKGNLIDVSPPPELESFSASY
jgi:hypothetical protein